MSRWPGEGPNHGKLAGITYERRLLGFLTYSEHSEQMYSRLAKAEGACPSSSPCPREDGHISRIANVLPNRGRAPRGRAPLRRIPRESDSDISRAPGAQRDTLQVTNATRVIILNKRVLGGACGACVPMHSSPCCRCSTFFAKDSIRIRAVQGSTFILHFSAAALQLRCAGMWAAWEGSRDPGCMGGIQAAWACRGGIQAAGEGSRLQGRDPG